MSEHMDFANGKYTVINDNGALTALRNGEPWGRDLIGDNLVYSMLVKSLELQAQRDELLEALRKIKQSTVEGGSIHSVARAAIAKATGELK